MVAIDHLVQIRSVLAGTLDGLTESELFRIPDGFSNHIAWNVAHVIVTQQILHYRLSGLETHTPSTLVDAYRKGTGPETAGPVTYNAILGFLHSAPELLREDYANGAFSAFTEYVTSTGIVLHSIDDAILYNNIHEGMHIGYVMAMKRTLAKMPSID